MTIKKHIYYLTVSVLTQDGENDVFSDYLFPSKVKVFPSTRLCVRAADILPTSAHQYVFHPLL
jgi:hypothetical protein